MFDSICVLCMFWKYIIQEAGDKGTYFVYDFKLFCCELTCVNFE